MQLSTKQLDALGDLIGEAIEQRFASHTPAFNPEKFGGAMGDLVREAIEPLGERIKVLEARSEGMQSKLDKCVAFGGDFQSALDYKPGTMVRRENGLFLAVRHIKAGGQLIVRDGSGWERIL